MNSKNQRTKSYSHNNENSTFLQILRQHLKFTFLFFIMSILFILVVSIFLFNTNNPTKYINLALNIVMCLSVFICSLLLSKCLNEKIILNCLIYGIIITAIFFVLSLIFNGDKSIVSYGLIPIFSIAGGVIGIKRERKRKKRRHW